MKLFKTNGRYKLHNEGFHYIAEFNVNFHDKQVFGALRRFLLDKYGSSMILSKHDRAFGSVINDVWRWEIIGKKSRRIYVKNENIITFAMLMIS